MSPTSFSRDSAANRPTSTDVVGRISFTQEARLLAGEVARLSGRPDRGAHFPTSFRIDGPLDFPALQRALDTVIARHESLRSVFLPTSPPTARERLMQLQLFHRSGLFVPGSLYRLRVEPEVSITIERVDCDPMELATEEGLSRAIGEVAKEPLRADGAPMMRARLLKVGAEDHVFVAVLSHLSADGWSVRIFQRELIHCYDALRTGAEPSLPPVLMQYPEFAAWEHEQLRAGALAADIDYWQRQYEGLADAEIRHHELPFARTPGPGVTPEVHTERFVFDGESTARMRAWCRTVRVPPSTLFRAAFTNILHAHTKKPRIALWTNFANRRERRHEGIVGWCATRHLVAIDVAAFPDAMDLCRHVFARVSEGQQHQSLSLTALWMKRGRTAPLADTSITVDFTNRARASSSDEGTIRPLRPAGAWPWMDLDFRVVDDGQQFTVNVTCAVPRYEADSAERLWHQLSEVLQEWISRAPHRGTNSAYRGRSLS